MIRAVPMTFAVIVSAQLSKSTRASGPTAPMVAALITTDTGPE